MAKFEKIFHDLIEVEGGYSNHKLDPGGRTKYGITEAVARENGYRGSMIDLSIETARDIYYRLYYRNFGFHRIQNTKIAGELFEFTVNIGDGHLATKLLQRAYNLLNKNIHLTEDGKLGPITAKTINEYKYYKSLYKVMNIFQGVYYIALAEKDYDTKNKLKHHEAVHGSDTFKTFIRGWIDKRVTFS